MRGPFCSIPERLTENNAGTACASAWLPARTHLSTVVSMYAARWLLRHATGRGWWRVLMYDTLQILALACNTLILCSHRMCTQACVGRARVFASCKDGQRQAKRRSDRDPVRRRGHACAQPRAQLPSERGPRTCHRQGVGYGCGVRHGQLGRHASPRAHPPHAPQMNALNPNSHGTSNSGGTCWPVGDVCDTRAEHRIQTEE